MDVSFSAKTQTFSILSPSSLSVLSPLRRIESLHRDFLGCGHKLRPPGLRYRRKCKKLGFQIHSPSLLIRASLNAQSILVVVSAVVTVSALTVVYLRYSQRKEKPKKISGPVYFDGKRSVDESQDLVIETRGINNDTEDDVASLKCKETALMHREILTSDTSLSHGSADESQDLVIKTCGIDNDTEDKVASLEYKETVLMHEEILTSDSSLSHGLDIVTSIKKNSLTPRNSEVTDLSFLPSLSPESGTPPIIATEKDEMHLEGYEQETEILSELPLPPRESELLAAIVPPTNLQAEVDKLENLDKIAGDVKLCSYDGIHVNSARKELYTFYEVNQFTTRTLENFSNLKAVYSHASLKEGNSFASLKRSSKTETNFFPIDVHNAGNYEGKLSLRFNTEDPHREMENSGKRRGFTTDKEKGSLHHNVHRNLLISSYPKGNHIIDKNDLSQRSSAYNRFLKDGRLIDCLELLEDMERMNMLDMNQIYHARFFRVCKSQKAVKEAFRFTKLIPNPTLSTFNMLLSVCAISQDMEGAFQVLQFVQEAGLKADRKLYTTLISTCAKCGKVDVMFKVFHEMVNAGVEPNAHTYGALIDGCAKAGQVAKAFGAYGIMRSKNVKPDRVVFNALITACGQSGAVDRAFDVLSEMRAESIPIDPDHVTVGALIKACANAGQVERAREVYNMIHEYNIKGTPELYTIAVNSSSQTGDWEFACSVYSDMTRKGIVPDEMFISAFIDVAGHAGKLESAFEILQEAKSEGMHVGIIPYSSLMGACSNAKNWQKALELYEDIKIMNLRPTVSTMNALITALCDGDQLQKAVAVLFEMKKIGLCPNTITYSILLVASEKKDDLEVGLLLLSQAKKDGLAPNLVMCRCLIALCLRRFEKACTLGEPVMSLNLRRPQIDNKWTSLVLRVYREAIIAGVVPTMEEFSQVLRCLRLPHDTSLRNRLIENLGVSTDASKGSNLCSLLDGFGEYDPRAFSLLEEAASLGIVPCVSFKESPIVVDVRKLQIHSAEVYLLTVLKSLKHRLAAGVKLPNITILLPTEKTQFQSPKGEKTINLAGRISRSMAALLRRLGISYIGNESYGKIRINGVVVKKWFQPKLASPFSGKITDLSSSQSRLARGIIHQQRNIRTGDLSLE